MAKQGKRLRKAYEGIDRAEIHRLSEVVKAVKSRATAKFDETIEIAMNLNIDPRKADQNIRGLIQLPSGTGKSVRVAVFAKGEKAEEAEKAGADIVGGDDLAKKIQAGEINFDRCIAMPEMMPIVGKIGRILGPKGLMPNPKLGTVTTEVGKAVKAAKAGQVEYRADKEGIIHAGIGKASFSEEQITANVKMFAGTVLRSRPSSVKGTYVKKVSLGSTMGPSFRIEISDLGGSE